MSLLSVGQVAQSALANHRHSTRSDAWFQPRHLLWGQWPRQGVDKYDPTGCTRLSENPSGSPHSPLEMQASPVSMGSKEKLRLFQQWLFLKRFAVAEKQHFDPTPLRSASRPLPRPRRTTDPDESTLPRFLSASFDSPVSADWSTLNAPGRRFTSAGMMSPGRTRMMSPGTSSRRE